MKKTLLFTTLSIAFLGNSQSLTQANEAAVGETQTMYVCDSFIDKLANITGSGVTWDFTDLAAYTGETRNYTIGDATTSTFSSDFPSSVKTLTLGSIETFYNSSSSDRNSQGFVFNEPTLGVVKAIFNTDEAKLMEYPFSNGSSFSDTYSGTLYFTLVIPQTASVSGEIDVMIDGQGTLNLPNGVTYSNVIRVVSADSSNTNITSVGEVVIKRTQYEYYDIANSNLPVLTFTTIDLESGILNDSQTLVLAKDDPMQYVGLDKNNTVNFSIAPNPSTDKITLTGEFSDDAIGTIIDQNGKVMLTSAIKNGTTLDISTFANGIYFLNINSNGNTTSKTIVKK